MSQYGFGDMPALKLGGLRIHSPDDYEGPPSDHRAASLAALNSGVADAQRRGSVGSTSEYRAQSPFLNIDSHPASLLAPGGPMAEQRPSIRQHDSLFLSATPANDPSTRTGTMVSGDYAFNPEQQPGYADQHQQNMYDSRTGTLLDSQAYFSDFAGQSYDQPPQGSMEALSDTRRAMPSLPRRQWHHPCSRRTICRR